MSENHSFPDGKAKNRGDADAPGEPVRPGSPAPATSSDFLRFPEHRESPEITSLVSPEARAPGASPGANPDFDPQIEIERRIGVGGMGEVFLGLQKHLGRKVAVKRIRDWGEDAENKARFIQEAKAQSRLQHPGIAQVYDLREAQGELYLIMEHVEGKTLEELQKTQGKFPPEKIAQIGIQLTEALESAAHEGYIHRDLKPANVMLTQDGRVKIIDFGLALRFRNLMRTRFTQKGDILGTPAYMSPEQLNQEENLEVRSDIWSLGVLLYSLATGEPPFTGKDFVCTVKNVMMAEPAPLPTIEPGFPPGLWQTIAKALRKERTERWQDYASFREALRSTADSPSGREERTPAAPVPAPTAPGRGRSRLIALGSMASLLLAALLLWHVLGGPGEDGRKSAQNANGAHPEITRGFSPETDASSRPQAAPVRGEEHPAPANSPEAAQPPKSEPPPKATPASLRLREKLVASPPTEAAVRRIDDLLLRFENHYQELGSFSYENLEAELASLRSEGPPKPSATATAEDQELFTTYLRASEKLVGFARGSLQARLEELRSSKGPVTLKLRAGGSVSGTIETITATAITLKDEGGLSSAVALARISPEEFRPKAAPSTGELAFQALSLSPAQALPALLELESTDEEVLLWIPVVVRLARLEVEAHSRQATLEAKPLLEENRPPEGSTACLAYSTAAKMAGELLEKSEGRMPAAYGFLAEEFARARREVEALELLFHRQFSRVAAVYRTTSSGPVGAALLLDLFEKDLASASDELLEGSGWFHWRWELRPTHADVKERMKYLIPKPSENLVVLQDPEGPRSLVMNDITSRAPEGVLLRVRLEPLGNHPDQAEWRFHLVSEKGGTSHLRVDRENVEVYRSTLAPGVSDVRLAQASLPIVPVEQKFRTFTLVPGVDHLHVYADRQLVLSIPREDGMIPKQLAFVVLHGKASIRNLEAKQAPAADRGSRK
jgi:serine/threonine protein kinase